MTEQVPPPNLGGGEAWKCVDHKSSPKVQTKVRLQPMSFYNTTERAASEERDYNSMWTSGGEHTD